MNYTTLIEAADLAKELATLRDSAQLVVVDCRYDLFAPQAGAAAYARGHIPGAFYAHLDHDLAQPQTAASGRHPLPDVDTFVSTLRGWGIGPETQVVVYDDSNGATAGRLWWMLRWLGHSRVAVLNGGWKQWLARSGPQTDLVPQRAAGAFCARADRKQWVSTDEISVMIGRPELLLIDARATDRFSGRSEPIDPIAGHVPGARSHPLTLNLDTDGRFLAPEELRRRWLQTLGAASPASAIAMCGSGVSACHNLIALELAGLGGARLYPGSWSEWIRDRARPIATSP